MLLFLWILGLSVAAGFRVQTHPLEKRIAYITELPNIRIISSHQLDQLKLIHQRYPLLIIKNQNRLHPKEFLDFLREFDEHHDQSALREPLNHPQQMLQPFDQFPECPHVAPRGNGKVVNFRGIGELDLKPSKVFMDKYVWHVDLLGHETKLPNVITGFNIVTQPLIGGDTDFISGETVYEHLSETEQAACRNMLLQVNRRWFAEGGIPIDDFGCSRINSHVVAPDEGATHVPLVYPVDMPSSTDSCILLLPSFFVKVVGWSRDESQRWMRDFMTRRVLPHRVSVQWKQGDLAIMNNRRFIHSSTPANRYMNSQRLLLQAFVPTREPLYAYPPDDHETYATHMVKWTSNLETSQVMTIAHKSFVGTQQQKYLHVPHKPGQYVLSALGNSTSQ